MLSEQRVRAIRAIFQADSIFVLCYAWAMLRLPRQGHFVGADYYMLCSAVLWYVMLCVGTDPMLWYAMHGE